MFKLHNSNTILPSLHLSNNTLKNHLTSGYYPDFSVVAMSFLLFLVDFLSISIRASNYLDTIILQLC